MNTTSTQFEVLLYSLLFAGIFEFILAVLKLRSVGTLYRRGFGKHYKLGKILTKNEYSFYMKLRKALPNEILLFPKVRMEDFLDIVGSDKPRFRGYVRCRHIDFLAYTKNLKLICGIEVDDSSHEKLRAKRVDKLKNDVFKEIKVPLLRYYNRDDGAEKCAKEVIKYYNKIKYPYE